MSEVKIIYHGLKTIIEYKSNEKLKEIFDRFKIKINALDKEIFYQYNGEIIKDENLIVSQLTSKKIFTILAYDPNIMAQNINSLIKSEYVICPKCKESAILEEKDYKLKIYGCQNEHITNNILINYSKIICQKCHQNYIYSDGFHQCNICKIYLCKMCISTHDNNHKIINYNDREFICNIHNEKYNSYCNKCKKNICAACENSHNEHELIYYDKLIIEDNRILKYIEETKKEIDIFNKDIKEKIIKLNKIIENIEGYYNIIYNIIQKYINDKKKNYQILITIDKIINNNIINNIKRINNNNNEYNDIIEIYNKIFNNKDNDIIDKDNKEYNDKNKDIIDENNIIYNNENTSTPDKNNNIYNNNKNIIDKNYNI